MTKNELIYEIDHITYLIQTVKSNEDMNATKKLAEKLARNTTLGQFQVLVKEDTYLIPKVNRFFNFVLN